MNDAAAAAVASETEILTKLSPPPTFVMNPPDATPVPTLEACVRKNEVHMRLVNPSDALDAIVTYYRSDTETAPSPKIITHEMWSKNKWEINLGPVPNEVNKIEAHLSFSEDYPLPAHGDDIKSAINVFASPHTEQKLALAFPIRAANDDVIRAQYIYSLYAGGTGKMKMSSWTIDHAR